MPRPRPTRNSRSLLVFTEVSPNPGPACQSTKLAFFWLYLGAGTPEKCTHAQSIRRKVRLPVPGMQQMGALNARLADYERQGDGLRFRVIAAARE